MKIVIAVMLSLVLWGCENDDAYRLGRQQWGDVLIEVQSRPGPVLIGMDEFLVMASDARGGPVHDLWIGMRVGDGDSWRQAIQDGFSGVYRKTLHVGSLHDQLRVRIKRGTEETEMSFPVAR